MDPVLRRNPVEYTKFVSSLHERGLIHFRPADGDPGRLGVFCVVKKDNSLRLVFDTRGVNLMFRDPPSTRLSSAGAFSRVDVPPGSTLYFAH
eukprot:16405310-Heterocapsa_arctica.AAC.1